MDFYLEPEKMEAKVLSAPYKLSFSKELSQEISLPDFYEDVARVIDCSASAALNDKKLSDGILSVSGEASYVILYYSGKDSALHRFCFDQEFDAKWDVKDSALLMDAVMFCRDVQVKLYGARKLSVTMECDFTAYLCHESTVKIPSGDDVELLKKEGESFSYEYLSSEKTRYSEDFILPSEYPSIEEMVYFNMHCENAASERRSDGFIVSADAELFVLYTAGGDYIKFKSTLPVTAFVKGDACDAVLSELSVFSPKCAVISDSNGENRRIALDFEAMAKTLTFKNDSFSYVTDAYLTECECALTKNELSFGKAQGVFEKRFTVRDEIENDGQIKELLFARACPEIPSTRIEGDMLYGEGALRCTILAKNETDGISAYEHEVSFDVSIKLCEDAKSLRITLDTKKITLEESADGFAISADLNLRVLAFSESKASLVSDVVRGERAEESDLSMLIYYPDEDESLWEIGKRHKVSTEKIAALNDVSDDAPLNKKFILIPKK